MKQALSVLLIFLFVSCAAAQNQSTGETFSGGMEGRMCMAVQKTTGAALASDGQLSPLQVDSSGNLRTSSTFSFSGGVTDATKLEDAAHSSGDRGDFILGVADDNTPSPTSTTAGDYVAPAIAATTGALQVSVIQAFQSSAGGGLLNLEDSAHSSADAGVAVLAVRQDTLSSSVGTDGDYGNFKLDSNGSLWSRISTSSQMIGAEDNAIAGGGYGVISLLQRQDSLTSDSGTDGDAGYFKSDSVGALWTRDSAIEASYATVVVFAESSISNTYGTLLTNANGLKHLEIYNGTDTAQYISFDASTNHWYIPAGSTKTFTYQQSGLKESSNVSIKYDTNPSSGSVYVSAMY